ncbi:MAG: ribose 5-phosphate isomerase B [Bdellovibrionales bacterium]|nr:ribose 5-phosphate isomerase B [Bdellovibrionales bacterium]
MPEVESARKIWIASDHAGFALKSAIQRLLPNYNWQDLGPIDPNSSVDYPDFARKLGQEISRRNGNGESALGILVCGSGIGMSIAANKISGIRAALVENPISARLSREHNDANVLCLGSRIVAPEYGAEIAKVWLETPFSNDPRHCLRVKKISELDANSEQDS